ncbi:hypothetical protein SAMN02745664_1384 [Moraxella cuniculi DSM 21768]|uniref:Uncharacterized protein n=1 Tax=Moraxella cuniculi DSM 21768 TaxID=1122245 RepID=A0A1N7GCP4_9GAMM|nr:hypothetical protein [Moraxella cuniculi]OOS07815.1 hypothetical protein B0189_02050 [Moraxella cuniculi]SIS10385.1 hypothetical protein SAMN02745664_1384 [Moraxella cuniculi DSM 21768]
MNIKYNLGIVKDVTYIDDDIITGIIIDDISYFIYNISNNDYVLILQYISSNREKIVKNIEFFLNKELNKEKIKTVNCSPIIVKNENIIFFSPNKISIHFTYTNIIGALEIGIMVDIDGLYPKYYALLDDSEIVS